MTVLPRILRPLAPPVLAALVGVSLALLGHPGHAADRLEPDDVVPGLVSGTLTQSLPEGLALQVSSTLDALANTRGGLTRGRAPVMLTELRAGFNLERLIERPGLSAEVHLIHHALDRINGERVGAMTGVTNIETVSNGTKLYRLWLEQEWRDSGRALRAGLFPLEDEFFTLDAAANFIHPTNGPQGDYATTLGAAIYNHAGFGVRLRQTAPDRSRYLMAALLDRPLEDTNFVRSSGLSFPRAPGLHAMIEAGLTPLEAGREPAPRERFDKLAAGLWAYSRRDEHLSRHDALGAPLRARSFGWYVMGERTLLARADGSGILAGFARLSGSDARASPIAESMNIGLRLAGAIPGRNDDVSSVMVAAHRLGLAWREATLAAGGRSAAGEHVLEINHRIALAPALSVMPLAQWISRPGGLRDTASARVVGARIGVVY